MDADALVARLAAGHNGSLNRRSALALGVTDKELRRLRASGVVVGEHRGVYRHAAVPPNRVERLHAALQAAGGDAVASHRSAAELHRLDRVPRWRPELTTTAVDRVTRSGVTVHRTTLLDATDRTTVGLVPTTTAARTLLDLGAVVPYEVVEHAVQDALIRGVTTADELLSVLERVGGRGRRGSAALRAVVRAALPDHRVESPLEHHLHRLLLRLPIEPPVLQHVLRCDDGRVVRLDAAWPARRLAIEGDGHRWHATSAQLRLDLARSRSIQASGWGHYRYGWADLTTDATRTLAELWQVVAL